MKHNNLFFRWHTEGPVAGWPDNGGGVPAGGATVLHGAAL